MQALSRRGVEDAVPLRPAAAFRAGLRAGEPLHLDVSHLALPRDADRGAAGAGRAYALSNNQLTTHHLNGPSEKRVLGSVQEVRQVLESLFGLTLPAAAELDPTLARVCGFHGAQGAKP